MFLTGGVCPQVADERAETIGNAFTIERLRRRCASKHRNSRRESAGWYLNEIARGVCSLLKWQGPEVLVDGHQADAASGPFNFLHELSATTRAPHRSFSCGCDLTAEWRRAKTHVRVRFPATAPVFLLRASARRAISLLSQIASRLAYTQKSRGQNLPERLLPRCITSSAPVSETGGPGAIPGGAANQ